MLRYLIKTLLQMNLFSDTLRDSNGTDLYNISSPTFNSSLLDWANFTGFNGKMSEQVIGIAGLSVLMMWGPGNIVFPLKPSPHALTTLLTSLISLCQMRMDADCPRGL
ncbi:hypothetical protein Q7C36_020067 [Tachysurus vachellii]|uniref:Uncharacterized protein n=1 Tax=Tachysurus vachellii TaxID=175792 RepID=A0AA88LSY7_TACVA|nr:hypothetical protein Q7C36_020067 [Tachysurus vachellii]